MIRCIEKGCRTELQWSGRGRRPKYCAIHKRARETARRNRSQRRDRAHKKGQSASRWGDLWLTPYFEWDPAQGTTVRKLKPVRRDRAQVWNATGESDDEVYNRSGVFHPTGKHGLPGSGHTIPSTDDYADLRWALAGLQRRAEEDPEAKEWLRDHPDWWRVTSDDPARPAGAPADEHLHFAKDIRETCLVHGGSYWAEPDESTPMDRCSWCWSWEPLILAGEFCSEGCMADFVRTFGPDGRKGIP